MAAKARLRQVLGYARDPEAQMDLGTLEKDSVPSN